MSSVLYLPSTPLNIFVSIVLANQFEESAEIWLIDQKKMDQNPYLHALNEWQSSPFSEVKLFESGSGKGKWKSRKNTFRILASEMNRFQPDVIAVGSDRRIEFQFLMSYLQDRDMDVEAWYLDDGLYSYLGRDSHWLKDLINSSIKKAVYGFWWKELKMVGLSDYIDQCWLFKPANAHREFDHKKVSCIEPSWINHESIKDFSNQLYGSFDCQIEDFEKIDYFVMVPHPANYQKIPSYQTTLTKLLQTLKGHGRVAVKYHPRDLNERAVDSETMEEVFLVPKALALEFVLPNLPKGTVMIGDFGTAMLTSKWFRDDLRVISILDDRFAQNEALTALYKAMNIEIVSQISSVNELLKEGG